MIGSRWKRSNALSQGVLICPVSRAELCIAQSFCLYFDNYLCDQFYLPVFRLSKMEVPLVGQIRIQSTETLSSVQFWWLGERVIPVLIPNTAVKPLSGDGTHRNRWGE